MNYRKILSLSGLLMLATLMITANQNCAPNNLQEEYVIREGGDLPGSSTGDTFIGSTEDLRFSESAKALGITNLESFRAEGICQVGDSDLSKVIWSLMDSQREIVEQGTVECELGSFQIQPGVLQDLDCGVTYLLVAQMGNGKPGVQTITKECEEFL